jgi:hypothetical protein
MVEPNSSNPGPGFSEPTGKAVRLRESTVVSSVLHEFVSSE